MCESTHAPRHGHPALAGRRTSSVGSSVQPLGSAFRALHAFSRAILAARSAVFNRFASSAAALILGTLTGCGAPASEAINRSNVAHFILARESYDLALTNLRDWTTVLTMSSANVSGGYTNLYASSNPANPYTLYGKDRAIRVRILSITMIGGGSGEVPKGATVRFQRSVYNKQTGASQPLDSKIVTMAFTYKSNLQMTEQQRIENPLGFQVTDYRVDTDYASSPPEEVPTEAKPAENASATSGAAPFPGTDGAPEAARSGQVATSPAQPVMQTTPSPPGFGTPGVPVPTAAAVAPTGANQGTPRR